MFFVAQAHAEAPARTALHWTRAKGAERCIDGRALARRVEALTGPLFVAPAEAERSLEGSIAPARRGFTARIVSVSAGGAQAGERVLATKQRDCRALDAALVFVTALTLDPELARTASPALLAMFATEDAPEDALLAELEATPPAPVVLAAPEAMEPPPAPSPPPPPQPPPLPVPVPPARGAVGVEVSLGAAWLGRTLPGWSPGPEARLQLDLPRVWPLALTVRAFPRAAEVAIEAGRAQFRAYALALSTCPLALGRGRVQVAGCMGAELGHVRGRGMGFARNRDGSIWEPSMLAEARLHVAVLRGLGLYGGATAAVRLLRQRFAAAVDAQRDDLLTPPRLGVLVSVGASYTF